MDQKMKLYDADGNELKAPEAGHGGPRGGHGVLTADPAAMAVPAGRGPRCMTRTATK